METEKNNKETVSNDEALSKSIDELIDKHFSENEMPKNEDKEDLKKSNKTKDNKEVDVEEDEVDKAKKSKNKLKKEFSYKEENEDKEDKIKSCKKSQEKDSENDYDLLKKSFEEEKNKNDELRKSIEEVNDRFNSVGEIFKDMKQEIDLLKSKPNSRKSIKNIEEIKKSFNDTEEQDQREGYTKEEAADAIEELVKSGEISSSACAEFEMFKKISNPVVRGKVSKLIVKNRK